MATNVTDKNLTFEERLIPKLDLMIKRMEGTDDNVVTISGDEGQGKTNLASGLCYYISYKTGRHYGIDNIFFDLDEMVKFASETHDQIIHWDEGALGGLAVHWWKENQIKLVQLLMIARKKRHFIIICIPKFYKLNEYIIVDRSIALIHVYSRSNIEKGRFLYYNKKKKEKLFDAYHRSHRKDYKKYRSFGGDFQEYMKQIFTDEELKQYEDKKDKAILSLNEGKEKGSKRIDKLTEQRSKLICFLKDRLGITANVMSRELKDYGLELSDTTINDIIFEAKREKAIFPKEV